MVRNSILKRKNVPDPAKLKIPALIAYDLETTRIEAGTPKPLYLTACGNGIWVSQKVKDIEHLGDLVIAHLLTEENSGAKFVAHNGNKFDAYFIAASLLYNSEYHIAPYLAGDSNFRGMKITKKDTELKWEFLDSMAMTGCLKSLKEFLKTFAPNFGKLESPNFDAENFDASNKNHRDYAERDSEGLFHAIEKAQSVVMETFGMPLQSTVGNLGIKLFAQHLPESIELVRPPSEPLKIIRNYLMRGGYCYLHRKFSGAVWRYDINQAYAHAMREGPLPGGRCMKGGANKSRYAECAMYRIRARNSANTIPFYCISSITNKAIFALTEIDETWVTSVELEQLEDEGWLIEIIESYIWETSFSMSEYVNKLENLRHSGEGGVKGAQGEMIKAIGNNSYGKTVESLRAYELCMAAERPEGWGAYYDEESPIQHVWFRFTKDDKSRDYHQPQVGAFITAIVRMQLRRAILTDPENFIYADTDGITFSAPSNALEIDGKIYGKWKIEAENEQYIFIDKKVYCSLDANVKHAKGLNIRPLGIGDFQKWYAGDSPMQKQTQRNSFLKTMSGANMFREISKRGSLKNAQG